MNETPTPSGDFLALAREILAAGHSLRFKARGHSMTPFVRDGDILTIAPVAGPDIQTGDIAFYSTGEGKAIAHRVHGTRRQAGAPALLLTRGDASAGRLDVVESNLVLGKAVLVERNGVERRLDTFGRRAISLAAISLLRFVHFLARVGRRIFLFLFGSTCCASKSATPMSGRN